VGDSAGTRGRRTSTVHHPFRTPGGVTLGVVSTSAMRRHRSCYSPGARRCSPGPTRRAAPRSAPSAGSVRRSLPSRRPAQQGRPPGPRHEVPGLPRRPVVQLSTTRSITRPGARRSCSSERSHTAAPEREDEPQSEERPEPDRELPYAIAPDPTPDGEAGKASSNHQECPPVPVEEISPVEISPVRGPGLSHDSAIPHSGAVPHLLTQLPSTAFSERLAGRGTVRPAR
jgi:hypothetical protein